MILGLLLSDISSVSVKILLGSGSHDLAVRIDRPISLTRAPMSEESSCNNGVFDFV